jgi:peptidoglycan/LPS O-acetylase OafA/YrhL
VKTQPKHIDFLDALRAVAILGVLICHTYAEVYGYGYEFNPWQGWYRTFAANAAYWFYPFSLGRGGVALFFVISGFCIHISFMQSEQSWRRRRHALTFLLTPFWKLL